MRHRDLRRAGHLPTLWCAFLYFDTSFMIWILLGALGNALGDAFRLTPAQKGLMVAVPILSGTFLRLVSGVLADRIGARRTALYGMALTVLPLLMGWLWASRFSDLLLVGVLLGVAGASFAVALPMASRWYPAEHQGLVLGITGMGNSGSALATLMAPWLIPLVGWRGVFGLCLIPLAVVFTLFALLARDSPAQRAPKSIAEHFAILRWREIFWYSVFYAVTFGGFVGLVSFMPIFFRDQYGVDPIRAGTFAALCSLVGSILRPVGGFMADRLGGIWVLFLLFLGLGFLGMRMSYLPHLEIATLSLFLILGLLGLGNGAVFQLIPQRLGEEMGVVTGIVGAAGGVGGFLLPLILANSKEWTGRFGPGFFVIGMVGFAAAGLLIQVSREWHIHPLPSGELPRAGRSTGAVEHAPILAEVAMEAIPR